MSLTQWRGRASIGLVVLGTIAVSAAGAGSGEKLSLSQEAISQVAESMLGQEGQTLVRLSLQECIDRALRHNLDIKVEAHGPAISIADVVEAEAAFDAALFGSAQYDYLDQVDSASGFVVRTDTTGSGTVSRRVPTDPFEKAAEYQYAMGLQKRLPTGATMAIAEKLRRATNKVDADDELLFYNPFYEYSLEFSLNQPLLRDFGLDFNRASINTAKNNHRASQQEFNLAVIDTVAEVEGNYWRLILARQQVKIYEALIEQAAISLRKMRARERLDSYAEVIHSNRALLARGEAALESSRTDLQIAQDQLLESLNDPELSLNKQWEVIPTDTPATTKLEIDRVQAMDIALQMRPELHQQRLRLDTAGIAVGVAENQTLPRLDLFADYEITGAGHDHGDSWDRQWRNETGGFTLGMSFEVPLGGNRGAQAALSRARHQQRQETSRLDNFLQQVLIDVSITEHTLSNKYKEIVANNTAAQAETNTLRAHLVYEESESKITSDFLDRKLRTQERVAVALIRAAQTIFEYNVTIMQMYKAQGMLLQYNNIKLKEMRAED